MIIDCISDLHGHFPELPGGDLLIVAGDLTARDTPIEYQTFKAWLLGQNYKKKIVIAGNHDGYIEKATCESLWVMPGLEYLCDSGTEYEFEIEIEEDHKFRGTISYKVKKILKIWGSPWTKTFPGINPKCCAFTIPFGCDDEDHISDQWNLIPEDTDILITHCPPFGIFDSVQDFYSGNCIETGSVSLRNKVMSLPNLKLHVFGHIHEHGGKVLDTTICKFVNASHVNENYKPVNGFVRIEL